MPTTCSCVQIFSFYKKINKNYKKHTHNLLHLDMVAPETPQKSEKGAKQNVKPEDVSGGSAESAASLGQRNHGDPEDEQPRSATLQTEKNGTERPQLNGETETPDHQKTKSVQMVESPETKKAEHTKEVNLIDLDGEVLYENKKEEATSGTSDSAEEALICRHTTRNVRKCAHNFVMGITDISPTADCNVACGLCHACKKCVDNYNMSSKSSKSLGQPIPGEKEGEGTIPVTTAQTEEVSGDSAKSAKSLGQPIPTKQEDEGTISGTTETEDVSGASAKSDKTLGEPNPAKQKDEQQTEVSGDGTKSTVSLGQPNPTKQEDVGPKPAMVSQTEDVSGDSTETKSLDQPIPAKQEDEQPKSVMTQTELVLGDGTKSIVNLGQPNAAKQEDEGTISAMAPQTEDIGTTPDHQKKTRRVGFCDAEAVESPEPKKAEDTKEVNFMDMEGGKEDATSSTTDGAEKPLICRHKTPKVMKCAHVFAMRIPEISSTADCKKTPNPCHTCTDCVDNYKNSSKDDKEREKKNEKGDSLPRADSVSPDSKSSGAKNDSEKSKETDSSEKKDVDGLSENAQVNAGQEECNEDPAKESEKSNKEKTEDGGQSSRNSCEDPDATLCYPDIRKPSECIIRLSNAGLYELQSQVKVENDDLQKATPSFFIKHQQLQGPSKGVQKKVQMEMVERVDIEKGEPESKPLIRNHRSMSADEESVYRGQMCCRLERSCVKAVGSFLVSIIVFPPLIYAAYAWLPFDAPVMPDIPTRLVYTLRCGAFASFPIVLGVIIHGISRLCVTSFDPFKPKEREVKIHRHFVKQTTFLFVLYLFNMAVLSTYLPQSYLKLIPLLTCVFALSQLIYWLSFAVGRSFRGFGYGLMFMPLLIMLSCNLCFIFLVDPEKMVPLGTPKERVKSGP